MDGMPSWVKKPGEIERQLGMSDDELMAAMTSEVVRQAYADHSWAVSQEYPSSNVPADLVCELARKRERVAERLRLRAIGRVTI